MTISTKRVLIAGVGYQYLRDLSLGPSLLPALRQLEWPENVEIEDMSFGPISIVQRFEEEPGRYSRIIFISAMQRGREPGSVSSYRWEGVLPGPDEIQQRIGEAIMGVISLDNLLVIAQHFRVLPDDVYVVEVEPEDTGWGAGFTLCVETAKVKVLENVRRLVMEPSQVA